MKAKLLYLITLTVCFSSLWGLSMSANYKVYGQKHEALNDDSFLTTIGGLGYISNSISRIMFGFILDKLDFKIVYLIMNSANLFLSLTIFLTVESKVLYFIYIQMSFLFYGGFYSILPA